MTHDAETWPRIAQAAKVGNIPTHQKHYKADDLRRTALILRNGVFLPPTIKKIRCATYCPKTSRICYTHQKHLEVDNLGRSP